MYMFVFIYVCAYINVYICIDVYVNNTHAHAGGVVSRYPATHPHNSLTVTRGVCIAVSSVFVPSLSREGRFFFSYSVCITHEDDLHHLQTPATTPTASPPTASPPTRKRTRHSNTGTGAITNANTNTHADDDDDNAFSPVMNRSSFRCK